MAGLAAPAAAQTTVTSNGREGPTACLSGQSEIAAGDLSITALTTTSIRYTTSPITWNQYVGRLGDVTPSRNANLYAAVYNTRTDSRIDPSLLANITNTNGYSGHSTPLIRTGLSAKTNYYLEVYAASSGSIPEQVFARKCFMTGGTYTMNVAPNTQGRSSGCYSISPLTMQDVRNCWCGRKTTLPLFSSTQDNTDFLNRWGCR